MSQTHLHSVMPQIHEAKMYEKLINVNITVQLWGTNIALQCEPKDNKQCIDKLHSYFSFSRNVILVIVIM